MTRFPVRAAALAASIVLLGFAGAGAANAQDLPPVTTIAGPTTTLNEIYGLAVSASGEAYAADNVNNKIDVFAAGASGDVAPIRTIQGPSTGLDGPSGIAFDSAGLLYVSNQIGGSVTVYASGSNGDASPLYTIAGLLTGLTGGNDNFTGALDVALDSSNNLYVSNIDNLGSSIRVFPPAATGNVTPTRTIAGADTQLLGPWGMDFTASGELVVADYIAQALFVFAPNANGDVAPIRVLAGAATGITEPYFVIVAPNGTLITDNYIVGGGAILFFAAEATGNVAPTAEISGPLSGISGPSPLDLVGNNLWVSNYSVDSIDVYAVGAILSPSPAPGLSNTGVDATLPAIVGGSALLLGILLLAIRYRSRSRGKQ